MSENAVMWLEIVFNIGYLLVVWGLVLTMFVRRDRVAPGNRQAASLVMGAFGLLALGDSGHVGFRVWAYALGGLEARLNVAGSSVGLVGIGALSTAVTVTFFYVLMLALWRERFNRRYGWFGALLLAAAVIRLALMTLPMNEWGRAVPVQPWSTIRNIPLMVQGLGVAYLILRDARREGDRTFTWLGAMILVSYACYMPVIFFVQAVPMLGMLMIPKTLAYLVIGFLAYFDLYRGVESTRVGVMGQPSS
jgi:hypothetical protein